MAAGRNGLIDYGRFVAALGIVWFQIQAPGSRIAYVALPFLLVVLAMPSSGNLAARTRRLIIPFIVWSLIFGVLNTALAVKQQAPPLGWWEWQMLLTGTWSHLWILPFAFLAALVSPWFQHPLASLGTAWLVSALLVVKGTPEAAPFGYWTFGIIPVLVSIAHYAWGWRLAVITLVGSFLILHFGRPSADNITILIGTALGLAAMSYRLPATTLSDWCARLSVWIYLAHPLVIIIGQSLRITWIELGLFSLVGSAILAQILESAVQSSRRGRWVL